MQSQGQRLVRRVVDQLEVGRHHSDEHPDPAVGELVGPVSGVLDRLPGGGQEQPFLRVHPLGLAAGDAEEGAVEAVDAVEEPAPLAVRASRGVRPGVEDLLVRPPAGRHLGHAVLPGSEVAPELRHVDGLRVAACDADHCDGAAVRARYVGGRRGGGGGRGGGFGAG
ncbi:hypothetical protein GCM10027073_15770 [Streptomyces chlorus]